MTSRRLATSKIRQRRIFDVALVLRLSRVVHAEEEVVGIEERRLGAVGHRVELPEVTARDEGAVLALVELRVDADVLEVLEDQLRVVDEQGRAIRREAETGREPIRVAGRGEEPPGLRGIVTEVLRALTELVDRQRPLDETSRDGGVEVAHAFV